MSDVPKRKSAGKPPISAHPVFPVIVALWFAALLGLGSLVLPTSMFERLAVASGLADVLEAAQPPLGVTARIAVALAAGLIGALAGVAIARRITSANRPTARTAAVPAPSEEPGTLFAKRPISAHEELFEGGFDADEEPPMSDDLPPVRTSALEVGGDSGSHAFDDIDPLQAHGESDWDEPLDLATFEPDPEPEFAPSAAPRVDDEWRFARWREYAPDVTAPSPQEAPQAPIAERALVDLGIVELVERFALALQRHREQVGPGRAHSAAVETSTPSAPTLTAFDEDEDEWDTLPSAVATPLTQGRDASVGPTFDHRLATDSTDAEDGDDLEEFAEESYPSLLAMKSTFGTAREPVRLDDDAGDDGDDDGDEPVVTFPGQARPAIGEPAARSPAGSGANERALRDALEKLQKMSGVA